MSDLLDLYRGKKIGVLMGGASGEREVSLRSGKRVLESLLAQGYQAVGIDVDRGIASRLVEEDICVAFVMLHGRHGEDGSIQGLLEQLAIPYTGSGVLASALSMDKVMSKKIFVMEGVPTPDYVEIPRHAELAQSVERVTEQFPFPVVVKPVGEGSSLGVIIADNVPALGAALEKDVREFGAVFVEQFIQGTSVTIGVLGIDQGTRALPVLELIPRNRFYDYEAKYTPGLTEFICPARLKKEVYDLTQNYGLRAHQSLGCRGFSRVDVQVTSSGKPYVLEVNTVPGMTELSDLPAQAEAEGISYNQLVSEILRSAPLETVA
jgi:D-alanine-D-alanine ligase